MGGPYEAFGDVRVAFIVELEAAVVHQPGPGSFHNPPSWQGDERVRVDAVDGLGSDVVVTAVAGEGGLEPGIVPDLREPGRLGTQQIDDGDAALVVAGVGGHHVDCEEQPVGVDDPERFASGDLLAGVVAPGHTRDGGSATNAAGIDDTSRRVRLATVAFSHQTAQTIGDAFPGAVT